MEHLKIFLADLTYDTITLSTDAFPLNIGFIGSYTKAQFGSNVEIKLFKYIQKLEDELERSPPDILGMSNYAWCYRVSREISKIFLRLNPNGIFCIQSINIERAHRVGTKGGGRQRSIITHLLRWN